MALSKAKIAARNRAREAKAKLDAERESRERKIEQVTTTFYLADGQADDARDALAAADAKRGGAVVELMDLEVATPEIAALCGIDVKEVRALAKEARSAQAVKPDGYWESLSRLSDEELEAQGITGKERASAIAMREQRNETSASVEAEVES